MQQLLQQFHGTSSLADRQRGARFVQQRQRRLTLMCAIVQTVMSWGKRIFLVAMRGPVTMPLELSNQWFGRKEASRMWQWVRSLFSPRPIEPEFIYDRPPEFGQDSPPDWVVEWQGGFLPGGAGFRGRLPLWSKETAVAEVEYPFSRHRPTTPRPSPVGAPAVRWLRKILSASFPGQILTVPPRSIDGIPVHLIVHRSEPLLGVKASCNLCDGYDLLRPYQQGAERSAPVVSCVDELERAVLAGAVVPPTLQMAFLLVEVTLALAEGAAPHGTASGGTQYPSVGRTTG
jgi:hypothetical protein